MKNIFGILTIISFILISNEANAVSPGPFVKGFKALGKFFKKGVDEVPDIGKKLEDLKSNKNIDEIYSSSSSVDNAKSYKINERILSDVENLNREELLEAHNIKKIKNRDADQFLDLLEGVDGLGEIAQTASIIPFVKTEWQGKIFKYSEHFNNPDPQKRIVIRCETKLEDFYFTALFDLKKGSWFLLSGNFTRKNKGIFIPPLKRQELLVLKDLDEYLYFSNKPKGLKKYPKKYFLINNKAKFISETNINEKKNPDSSLNIMLEKIDGSLSGCKRTL